VLTQIQLRNFKSYRSGTLHLAKLTVLIGANASGKSNLIEALRLLGRIAQGERLSFISLTHNLSTPQRNSRNEFGFKRLTVTALGIEKDCHLFLLHLS
jgi:AAA15 family ATPase/GTPase